MSKLVALVTTSSLALLALTLGGCPTTTNDGGDGGTTLVGDPAAGQAKYSQSCASCHSLGSFDTTGGSGNLKGKQDNIVNNLSTLSAAMTGITLTDQEAADLKAFIATQ